MDLNCFRRKFNEQVLFKANELKKISNVFGTNSNLIQHTINLAVNCLEGTGEAYFEVGCLFGSSLDAASRNNDSIKKYAADIVVQGEMPRLIREIPNLKFHHGDFFNLDLDSFLEHPVGVYYFDGPHDREPSINGLERIIPYLADKALILYDDIDGYSRAFNAWRYFMRKHSDQFMTIHEFFTPDQFMACTKGYPEGWWDGFAIAEFERQPEERDEDIEGIAIARYHAIGPYNNDPKVYYPKELKHIHGKEEVPR